MIASNQDEFLWLEEVEGAKALSFAKEQNEKTFASLKGDPNFASIESGIRQIILAKDRLPGVSLQAGKLYNFWQDQTHVRGIWRRTTLASYKTKSPVWETVIDLDALAKSENENWVWKGSTCLAPAEERCLIKLSRGGKDASVYREFDVVSKSFIAGGFELPEAKSDVSWFDLNTLYVGTDFGDGSLTDSGYPMLVKVWARGEPLSKAREVFRGQKTDVASSAFIDIRPEGTFRFIVRSPTFYTSEIYWHTDDGEYLLLPMPTDAQFVGVFKEFFLFSLRTDLKADKTYRTGSLVGLPIAAVKNKKSSPLNVIFTPTKVRFLSSVSRTKNTLLLDVLDKVKGKLLRVSGEKGRWKTDELPLGGNGVANVTSTDSSSDEFIASYTDFLTPTTLNSGDAAKAGGAIQALKASPERFNSSGLTSEQREAVSKDGTKIPYFIVHKKGMKKNGLNPTLLYGYGGFENSLTPWYSGVIGKSWLERGGVFVLANIRGGGEFGPAWHEAALKENRQRAFDDFIAVAEDLIRTGVTKPAHLGIEGGSNGGLLVGATFVQRPDLFNAVLCEVPLLDMLRYHRLLAGASWMAEYGNPDVPAEREYISRYSPFQNVKAGVKYPEVFFLTSTKDDRVHPGHARRMVARMLEQGHQIMYYENTEGGHGGSANLEQSILWSSLEFTYLWKKLAI